MRHVLARAAAYTGRIASGSANRVVGKLLERRYGGNTGEYLYLEEPGVEDGDTRLWHEASDWLGVRRALARLRPTRDDVFVDYGSGLGRAVLIAAGFPFKRVIGVEIAARMTPSEGSSGASTSPAPRSGCVGAAHWLGEYEPGYVFEKSDRLGGVWLERPSR